VQFIITPASIDEVSWNDAFDGYMDTCEKFEKLWFTYKGAWASERFFQGGQYWILPGGDQTHFSRSGSTVV